MIEETFRGFRVGGRAERSLIAFLSIALFLYVSSIVANGTAQAQTVSSAPEAPATASDDAASDASLQSRLKATLENYESLSNIVISVHGGVVLLAGEVPSAAERERAVSLAGRIEGVVDVRNELRISDDVALQASRAWQRLATRAEDYLLYLPVLALALMVFTLFWFLARWLSARQALYRRISPNRFVRQVAAQVVRSAVVILGIVFALEIVDATALIGAVLGAAGVTGLVIGFALKETVENYVAGVLLSLRQPFDPLDHVLIEGREGRVMRLSSRATILLTLEGNHVRLPNALVFRSVIVNFTRNPQRRFDFTLGLATDADLVKAQALAVETVRGIEGVLAEPAADGWLSAVGESSISLYVAGWVDQRTHSIAKVRSEAIRRVLAGFAAEGIETPEPIFRVNLASTPSADQPALTQTDDQSTERRSPVSAATARVTSAAPVDLSADRHLEREIARERALMGKEDLLDPAARKE